MPAVKTLECPGCGQALRVFATFLVALCIRYPGVSKCTASPRGVVPSLFLREADVLDVELQGVRYVGHMVAPRTLSKFRVCMPHAI